MSNSHKVFRNIIYSICLVISTSLIMYFLYHLSNNPIYHYCVPAGALAVEFLAQYFLSLGKNKFKSKKYLQGVLLISIYAFYVLLFGVLSAVAFFAVEISANISSAAKVEQFDTMAREQYNRNNELISSLNLQMTTEAKTGFGSNSRAILAEINRLKEEQALLIGQMNQKKGQTGTPVDSFSALSELLGVKANILALIIFGSLILFVYVGLTVCNPDLEFGVTGNVTDETGKVTVTDETVKHIAKKPVTRNSNKVTVKHATDVTGDLCVCGCGRPRTGRGLYFSGACRTRLSRRNKKEAVGA